MVSVKKRYNQFTELPPLDLKEFEALTDLLYEAVNGNTSAVARVLGIDRRTYESWIHTPPQWPWWNIVLRMAVKQVMIGIKGRRGSPTIQHVANIRDALNRIPNSTELLDEISSQAWEYRECEIHVRQLLAYGPMNWSEIHKAANSGGFTIRQLRAAAKDLGVIKTREMQGDSVWSLPEVGED